MEHVHLCTSPRLCATCGNCNAEFKCPCAIEYYCGPECQKDRWEDHKNDCTVFQVKEVQRLRKENGGSYTVAQELYKVASLLQSQSKYMEARKLFTRAMKIYIEYEGCCEHVAATLNNIAAIDGLMGNFVDSREKLERVLCMHRKIHGETHQNIATTLNSLGNIDKDMGLYRKAMVNYEKGMMISESCMEVSSKLPPSFQSLNCKKANVC
jgi:tetratricopeptide (TPR) repeat protein